MTIKALCTAGLMLGLAACTQTPQERIATQAADAKAATDLSATLAGLTPQKPTSCMPRYSSTQVKAYGPTIVYTVSRGLKYRTDTAGGCERIARGDILITRSPIGQVCQGDIATTAEPVSGIFSGSCSFGPFVRYAKGS